MPKIFKAVCETIRYWLYIHSNRLEFKSQKEDANPTDL